MLDAPKRLAAAYLRCSDSKQDKSVADQRGAVRQWAEANGFAIVREYADDGIPGDRAFRPGFEQMCQDAGRADWQFIIVWRWDRLSRANSLDFGYHTKPLRDAGTVVVDVTTGREVDWTNMAGRMETFMNNENANAYAVSVSGNVVRGRTAAARDGKFTGNRPPYGYRRDPETGKLTPVESEAAIVRRIFDEAAAGLSTRDIAIKLNADGICTRLGAEWAHGSVYNIIKNVAYTGVLRTGEHHKGKYSILQAVATQDAHEAIIPPETFRALQALLKQRRSRTTPQKGRRPPLFTGLLFCGHCGGPMHGSREHGRATSYRCGRNQAGRGCVSNRVQEPELLPIVMAELEKQWSTPEAVQTMREEAVAQVHEIVAERNVEALQAEFKRLSRDVERISRNLGQADPDTFLLIQSQYRQVRDECDRVRLALEEATIPEAVLLKERLDLIDAAVAAFRKLSQKIQTAEAKEAREFLAALVEKVTTTSRCERKGKLKAWILERVDVDLSYLSRSARRSCCR